VIVDSEFTEKYKLITGDPVKHRIFQAIAERLGVSGWEAAKRAGMQPDAVAEALNELSNAGIVKSTGPGLDGNYGLTGLGFALREQVVAGTRSRL
jgi:DNA-binding Lrp family transcriptional regulator